MIRKIQRNIKQKSTDQKSTNRSSSQLQRPQHIYLQLFVTFLKIGAFTFGGGYAMIPMIQREVVENKKWLSESELLEMVAIAEITPGPIAINCATFVGTKTKGVLGAIFATFGVVLPSFVIIAALSYVLQSYQEITAVRYAFWGVKAGVLALIIRALWMMWQQCPKNIWSYFIIAFAFTAVVFLKWSVLLVILCSALATLLVHSIVRRAKR